MAKNKKPSPAKSLPKPGESPTLPDTLTSKGAQPPYSGGPLASRQRAAEIAEFTQGIGLREFIELTGVGGGSFGIYEVAETGVSVSLAKLEQLSPKDQVDLLGASERLTLRLPCSADEFRDWYDGTRGLPSAEGEKGISDFPLAPGFLEALDGESTASKPHLGPPASSKEIAKAFRVKATQTENDAFWDIQLRDAKKLKLDQARHSVGRGRRPSMWYPTLVAVWLIERGRMQPEKAETALAQHFPEAPRDFLHP